MTRMSSNGESDYSQYFVASVSSLIRELITHNDNNPGVTSITSINKAMQTYAQQCS